MASFQRRGDNSWLLVVEAGYNAQGKRIRRTKTVRIEDKTLLKTKKRLNDHLELELAKFQMEVEAGEYIAPEKMLLKEFVNDWEKKYAVKELSESTLESYHGHIKNHILPVFGHLRLDQLRPIQVINFLSNLKRADGKDGSPSPATIQYTYRVLRNIFERAKEWQIIKENPVAAVKKPKTEKTKVRDKVYSEQEVEEIFMKMELEPLRWQVFISLALSCGFRRGEILGLEADRIDWDKNQILINQSIVRGKGGKPVIKNPKSFASERIVSVPESVMVLLRQLYMELVRERDLVKTYWKEHEHNWIFCNEDGTHFYPTTPNNWWRRFTDRKEIRYIRLHDLRHTSATLLINQGVHAKIIAERLGHADIRITMDTYGHALQAADEVAAGKLNDLFTSKKTQEK
ncbi:tyrosine-type recombinase/integrase [Siminovitchia terrae]|uniref:tyrosine-type recombinase/integrase n=1 Tax=Siminovitchia terrae TaxID=1914933 RepID=UPI0028B000AF|nr:site-specific integrase [Siminovitchia terrae]